MKNVISNLLLVLVLVAAIALGGCSSGPQPIDQDFVKKSTENAKSLRSVFDAAGGDYTKIPESEKTKLIELYQSEDNLKKVWETMKNPPIGGAPVPGGQ